MEMSPEAIEAVMRLDIHKLANERVEVKVFKSDDGYVYGYFEAGLLQGRNELLGGWRGQS